MKRALLPLLLIACSPCNDDRVREPVEAGGERVERGSTAGCADLMPTLKKAHAEAKQMKRKIVAINGDLADAPVGKAKKLAAKAVTLLEGYLVSNKDSERRLQGCVDDVDAQLDQTLGALDGQDASKAPAIAKTLEGLQQQKAMAKEGVGLMKSWGTWADRWLPSFKRVRETGKAESEPDAPPRLDL